MTPAQNDYSTASTTLKQNFGIAITAGPFTSLPRAQNTGGESPYIDPEDVLRLPIVGDSAVRLLIPLEARSAW